MTKTIRMTGPEPKYGGDCRLLKLTFADPEHTPYNMRSYEARNRNARGEFEFTRHASTGSLEVRFTEYTTNKAGNITSRTITVALGDEERRALAEFLVPRAFCTYPDCKCIVSTSTSQPEPECPEGLTRAC